MIPDLTKLQKELHDLEKQQEELVALSRKLTKDSKQAIYCIHRNELNQAEQLIQHVKKQLPKERSYLLNAAYQEYAEAALFFSFVQQHKVLPYAQLNIGAENYLCGLADLSGELERRAVMLALKKDIKGVQNIRNTVDEILGAFLQFDLKNGELRRKYDAIKWNLAKIERVLYDITLQRK